MKRLVLAAAAVCALAAVAVPAAVSAWGNTGHRLIGMAAVRGLPDDMPAFLRTPGAAADVGEFAREPDRWKGAGQPHDRERDTAHFIDMDDNAFVMSAAGPSIDALPRLKSEYDAALTTAGLDVNDAGYLPYAIWDGYQNLVRDFAYWRVLTAQEARETDPQKRAWYRVDRERREALILRDMGVLGHYVGDGSQPHHTTIHYNGWDRNTPNPEGFTTSRQTHGAFEGAFTAGVARLDVVEAAMPAPNLDGFDLRARVPAYLKTTLAQVLPFYRLEKAGAFSGNRPDAATFTIARLGAGAAELRDLYILAWRDSADDNIGWPAVKVAEVEAGTADPWLAMYGDD
jgi:hypothetical protein